MSETLNGAEPANLIHRPGTTAQEMAAMELEALTETEAGRRSTRLAPGALEPAQTDEQTAQAILDQRGDAPTDTRSGQGAPAKSRGAGPLGLWITWLVMYGLAVGIYAVLFIMVLSLLRTEPGAILNTPVAFLVWPLIWGTMQWLVLKRWLSRFHEWLIPATAGALFGSIVVHLTWDLVWSDLPPLLTAIVTGALLGASVGIGQWLALRRRFSRAGWWIAATTAGWMLAEVGELASGCLAFLAGSAPAALTGVVLVWLVQQTVGERAETVSRAKVQTCPHCGERVSARAVLCRHCKVWLVDGPLVAEAGERQPATGGVQAYRQGRLWGMLLAIALGALAALGLPVAALLARATACGPFHSSVITFAVMALVFCLPAAALPAALAWIMGRRRDGDSAGVAGFSVPRALAGGVMGGIISFAVSAVCAYMTFAPECL